VIQIATAFGITLPSMDDEFKGLSAIEVATFFGQTAAAFCVSAAAAEKLMLADDSVSDGTLDLDSVWWALEWARACPLSVHAVTVWCLLLCL
jgi:hypothetical protein